MYKIFFNANEFYVLTFYYVHNVSLNILQEVELILVLCD